MSYEDCLRDAMRLQKVSTPDERCAHLARSMLKMKSKYSQHEEKKRARSVLVISEAPKHVAEQKHTTNICQSTTLKGKKCTFKAKYGCFCKKHSISTKEIVTLGKKI
jgi:hypothetical protein